MRFASFLKNRERILNAFICVLFSVSFYVVLKTNYPLFDSLSVGDHSSFLTSHSLNALRNWFKEGAVNLGFLNILLPKSAFLPELADRQIYPSYPPGHLIIPHMISLLLNRPIELTNLRYLGLLNHLASSILVFLIAKKVLSIVSDLFSFKFILPAAASLFYFFLPANIYWSTFVYFADQAVIPFFLLAIYVLVCILSDKNDLTHERAKLGFRILLFSVMFLGMLTDYLFFFLAPIALSLIILQSFSKNQTRKSLIVNSSLIVAPCVLALSLFFIQLLAFNQLDALLSKYLFRSGTSVESKTYLSQGVLIPVSANIFAQFGQKTSYLGIFGVLIAAVATLFKHKIVVCRNERAVMFFLLVLSVIPCVFQVYFLKNHQVIHNFSAYKFSIPIVFSLFIFIPWALFELSSSFTALNRAHALILGSYLIGLVILFRAENIEKNFIVNDKAGNSRCIEMRQLSEYLRDGEHVLSTTFQTQAFPPMDAYCLSNFVKRVSSSEEIHKQRKRTGKTFLKFFEEGNGQSLLSLYNQLKGNKTGVSLHEEKRTANFVLYSLKFVTK